MTPRRLLLGLLSALPATLVAPTSAPASSVDREAAIVARALAYEKTLDERVGRRAIGIAVVHKPKHESSELCAKQWYDGFAALANVKIQDRGVTLKSLPYSLDAIRRAREASIDVFVVCDGLGAEAPEITRVSRSQRVLTVGVLPTYVEQSMTLGVFREDGKYQIVVNLRSAAEERVAFSSSMLKLARVLR